MRDLLYGKLREETIEDIEMAKHNSDIARFARLHFHNHHEIFYIEQGIFKICAPKEIYAGEGACIAFFKRGVYHGTIRVDCEKIPFRSYEIKCNSDMFENIPDNMLRKDIFVNNDIVIVPLENVKKRIFSPKIEELWGLCDDGREQNLRIIYSYITVILNVMVYNAEHQNALCHVCKPDKELYICDVVRTIMQEVDRGKNINASSLADTFYVSISKLSKDFSRIVGLNIKSFIAQIQMERINKMLKKGMSNKTIIEKLGFSSESYFVRFYRKYMGITPGEYRTRFISSAADNT